MTPTDIVNLALSKFREGFIDDIDDTGDNRARLAKLHYEPALREVLRAAFWSFAMKTVGLVAVARAATFANAQFRLTAVEDGLDGNAISIAVEGGHTAHSLELDGTSLTLRMGTHKRLTITGTTDPVTAGVLLLSPGSADISSSIFPGSNCWNSNGTTTAPVAGPFVELSRYYLRNEAAATLEELVPMADYTATASRFTATNFTVIAPGGSYTVYWLKNDGVLAPHWVKVGDGTSANRNMEVVAAGDFVTIERSPGLGFVGGILGQLQDAPGAVWTYYLYHFTDAVITHIFSGIGTSPETAVWTPFSGSPMPTGTPIVTATGLAATLTETAALFEDGGAVEELVGFEMLGQPADFVAPFARTLFSGGVANEEILGWLYGFEIPGDFVKAKDLWDDLAQKIDSFSLRRVGGKSCLLHNCEAATLEYVQYVEDPEAWDPLFTEAFVSLLASKLARAISGSEKAEADLRALYESVALPAARTACAHDSQSAENRTPLEELIAGNLLNGYSE